MNKNKRIILFRFHDFFGICNYKLRILTALNPNVPIYGLYGGTDELLDSQYELVKPFFKHIYTIQNMSPEQKWKNSDLTIAQWHTHIGHTLDFDWLHICEWDLLLLAPLDILYKNTPQGALCLTALRPLKTIEKTWWWTNEPTMAAQWKVLLEHVGQKYLYKQTPYCCKGPGMTLPRGFLDLYSKMDIPDLSNDELRLPLYAQVLNFPMVNTSFEAHDKQDLIYFNCDKNFVTLENILNAYANGKGRLVFHPVYDSFPEEKMMTDWGASNLIS